MAENAFVAWWETMSPWVAEGAILRSGLSLPLNVRDNPNADQVRFVQAARRDAVRRADELPVIADSDGQRRLVSA
jgi:hypothetical protein